MKEISPPFDSCETPNSGQKLGARLSWGVDALQPSSLVAAPPRGSQAGSPTASKRPAHALHTSFSPSFALSATFVPSTAPSSLFAFRPGLSPTRSHPQTIISTVKSNSDFAASGSKWRGNGAPTSPAANPAPSATPPQTSEPESEKEPQSPIEFSACYLPKFGHSSDPAPITPPRQQASSRSSPLDQRLDKLKHAQAAQKAALLKYEPKIPRSLSPELPLIVQSGSGRTVDQAVHVDSESLTSTLKKIASRVKLLPKTEAEKVKATLDRMHAESYPETLPLSAPWTLCSLTSSKESSGRPSYKQDRTILLTASTVPDLCGQLKALNALRPQDGNNRTGDAGIMNMLRNGSNLSFFRDSIAPTWEDRANEKGGRIIVTLKAGFYQFAFYDCLWMLAGSSLEAALAKTGAWGEGHIVGMVASCKRSKQDRIDIWISGPTPDREPSASYVKALKDALATELQSPEIISAVFKKHN